MQVHGLCKQQPRKITGGSLEKPGRAWRAGCWGRRSGRRAVSGFLTGGSSRWGQAGFPHLVGASCSMLPVRSPVTQIERYLPNHNGSALDGLTSNQAKRCPLCASHVELRQVICPAALPALRSRKWQFRSWADGDDKYPFALEGRDPNGAWAPHWSTAVLCAGEPNAPKHVSCRLWRVMFHVPCSGGLA